MSKKWIHFLDKKFYLKFSDRWDDKLLRDEILKYLNPEFVELDVGAGRGRLAEMNFKGLAKKVVGVDPDPRVKENPMLDEGHEGLGDQMPFFADGTFDL